MLSGDDWMEENRFAYTEMVVSITHMSISFILVFISTMQW